MMSWPDLVARLRDVERARIHALALARTLRDELAAIPGPDAHAAQVEKVCRTLDLPIPPALVAELQLGENAETTPSQPERQPGGLEAVRGVWRDRVRCEDEELATGESTGEGIRAEREEREGRIASRSGSLTIEQWQKIVSAGVVDKTELLFGRIMMGEHEVVFSPAQTRAAADLGVTVRSCIDAVLEDPDARAEVAARLATGYSPQQESR